MISWHTVDSILHSKDLFETDDKDIHNDPEKALRSLHRALDHAESCWDFSPIESRTQTIKQTPSQALIRLNSLLDIIEQKWL